jgi:hypothetical protein
MCLSLSVEGRRFKFQGAQRRDYLVTTVAFDGDGGVRLHLPETILGEDALALEDFTGFTATVVRFEQMLEQQTTGTVVNLVIGLQPRPELLAFSRKVLWYVTIIHCKVLQSSFSELPVTLPMKATVVPRASFYFRAKPAPVIGVVLLNDALGSARPRDSELVEARVARARRRAGEQPIANVQAPAHLTGSTLPSLLLPWR